MGENLPDEVFGDVVFLAGTPLDNLTQVALRTILHHNVYHLAFALNDSVVVADNVSVPQIPQDVNLGHNLLPLFLVHLPVV